MSGFEVARLDELEEVPYRSCALRPVRHHFGIAAFGVNAWTGHAAGDRLIPEHDDAQEELYLVLRGRAVFELDGERLDTPAGTLVFVHPKVNRTAFAEDDETSILALGGTPGRAYDPSDWEILNPLYEAGRYAEAADRARELTATHPQSGVLFYNLACFESLAGRPVAEAIEHLRHALELRDDLCELAKTDSDFDAIRDEPSFKELVGSS